MTSSIGRPCRILAIMDDSDSQVALWRAMALAERQCVALEFLACLEQPRDLGIVARLSGNDPDDLLALLAGQIRADTTACPWSWILGQMSA